MLLGARRNRIATVSETLRSRLGKFIERKPSLCRIGALNPLELFSLTSIILYHSPCFDIYFMICGRSSTFLFIEFHLIRRSLEFPILTLSNAGFIPTSPQDHLLFFSSHGSTRVLILQSVMQLRRLTGSLLGGHYFYDDHVLRTSTACLGVWYIRPTWRSGQLATFCARHHRT